MDNFKVEFSDVELDELSKKCRKNESGQIEYNITNQLFVPFDESELKEYLHNIKRKVKIKADIKYRISKECVGAGISITVDWERDVVKNDHVPFSFALLHKGDIYMTRRFIDNF